MFFKKHGEPFLITKEEQQRLSSLVIKPVWKNKSGHFQPR